jgi:hypothetical protein
MLGSCCPKLAKHFILLTKQSAWLSSFLSNVSFGAQPRRRLHLTSHIHVKFQVSTPILILVVVSRIMTPCSRVGEFQRFGTTFRLHVHSRWWWKQCVLFETLILTYQTTRCHNPEHTRHCYCFARTPREELISIAYEDRWTVIRYHLASEIT